MLYLIVLVILFIMVTQNMWLKRSLKKHTATRPEMPDTGAELAEHLIKSFNLEGVKIGKMI